MQIAIAVEDLDRAVARWEEMFGSTTLVRTSLEQFDAQIAMLQGPGFKLELLQAGTMRTVPALQVDSPFNPRVIGSQAIVVESDDVEALVDELASKGVRSSGVIWAGPVRCITGNAT